MGLLADNDPHTHLRGFQTLCKVLESGKTILERQQFSRQINFGFFSSIPKVRRWAYYSAQLLDLSESVAPLEFTLKRETDDECRLWAWSAYKSLTTPNQQQKIRSDPDFDYFGSNLELICDSRYGDESAVNRSRLENKLADDPISTRWTAIKYGYEFKKNDTHEEPLVEMDRGLIRSLQNHEDISVAEYAIWAFFNRNDGTSGDLAIPFESIGQKAQGIRGWAYRLLLKTRDDAEAKELAAVAIVDEFAGTDLSAQRGLARAIRNSYWQDMENLILPWLENNSDDGVRAALLEHMVRHADQCTEYESYIIQCYKEGEKKDPDILQLEATKKLLPIEKIIDLNKKIDAVKVPSVVYGDVIMGNKIKFGDISGINANVVNFGEMRDAVKDSLYQADHRHLVAPIKDELAKFLDQISQSTEIDDSTKQEAIEALGELSTADSSKIKNATEKAVSAIKNVAGAAKSSSEIVESASKILEFLNTA